MHGDPRAPRPFTLRGCLLGVAVLVFAIVVSAASYYFRLPQIEKTRNFLGSDTIQALQLSSDLEIGRPAPDAAAGDHPLEGELTWTTLSGSPGLSLFRRALLEEIHYDWGKQQEKNIADIAIAEPDFAVVRLGGTIPNPPHQEGIPIDTVEVVVELNTGWVGLREGEKSVQLTERARKAVENFVRTSQDVQRHPTR